MAQIDITPADVTVRLTPWEKLFALRGDVSIPRSAIVGVETFDEGLDAVRGMRAPGLAIPGRIKIGTWRRRGGKELVVVRRGRPAVRLSLAGERWGALIVGATDPEAVERALS